MYVNREATVFGVCSKALSCRCKQLHPASKLASNRLQWAFWGILLNGRCYEYYDKEATAVQQYDMIFRAIDTSTVALSTEGWYARFKPPPGMYVWTTPGTGVFVDDTSK